MRVAVLIIVGCIVGLTPRPSVADVLGSATFIGSCGSLSALPQQARVRFYVGSADHILFDESLLIGNISGVRLTSDLSSDPDFGIVADRLTNAASDLAFAGVRLDDGTACAASKSEQVGFALATVDFFGSTITGISVDVEQLNYVAGVGTLVNYKLVVKVHGTTGSVAVESVRWGLLKAAFSEITLD